MAATNLYKIFKVLIAIVWIINGLFCKVIDLVPRHQQIVARILGEDWSRPLTIAIGISEVCMAIWILSGVKPKLNAISQILIIATMNSLEFILASDLLLWKKFNALFAFMFICFIFYNEFVLNKRKKA